jgi:hypothetical protein
VRVQELRRGCRQPSAVTGLGGRGGRGGEGQQRAEQTDPGCGLHLTDDQALGSRYRRNRRVGCFNSNKRVRVVMVETGRGR